MKPAVNSECHATLIIRQPAGFYFRVIGGKGNSSVAGTAF